MNNKKFFVFFFFLGLVSIIGQGVILREITTLFYGNEMFYGLGLGLWLMFTGLGSFLAARIKNWQKAIWYVLAGLCLLLPLLIIILRYLVSGLVPAGQIPGLTFSLVFVVLILFIFCLPLGILFPLGAGKQSNKAYFWETVGLAAGGIIFSLVLATTAFPLSQKLNGLSLSWRYPNLITAINSKYNQIVVTETNAQKNIYTNGQLAAIPSENFENKQLFSLISPYVNQARRVLVVGNPSLTKVINKQFPAAEIVFLEIDKQLADLEKELLAPGVTIITADIKEELKKSFDLIIFNPGNPQTLLTNRYFTQETFRLVKEHLTPDGAFALTFYIPTDYQSQETRSLAASIYQTAKNVFPETLVFTPEDQILLINGQIPLKIISAGSAYFEYQQNQPKRQEIVDILDKAIVKINTDSEPVAFFYQQLFWQTMFNFIIPGLTLTLGYLLPVICMILLLAIKRNLRLGFLAGSSGFILMSLEILIIYLFQSKIGYLYSQICLIFAAVLSGMAVGVKIAELLKQTTKLLAYSFLAYLLISVCLGANIFYWLVTSFVLGVTGGIIFALVNKMYLLNKNNAGYIYAWDLVGSSVGAIMTSSLLLPIYGVRGLILGLGILVFINLKVISKLRR